MNIVIGSDHAGFDFKERLKDELQAHLSQLIFQDVGTQNTESVDYPDFADRLAQKMKTGVPFGILICGSGQGMCIRANRYPFIRAALVYSEEIAKLSRAHNNANVICLGARITNFDVALKSCLVFLKTEFEGGRHAGRVEKLKGAVQ